MATPSKVVPPLPKWSRFTRQTRLLSYIDSKEGVGYSAGSSPHKLKSSCRKEEVRMDAHKFPRFAVQCPITFSGGHIAGKGTVMNLS